MQHTMKFDHVFWAYRETPHGCRLAGLKGVPKPYQISQGLPVQGTLPSDAYFAMNPDFPDHTLKLDNLSNLGTQIVISERLKEFLENKQLPNVEYLRVNVMDHKSQAVSPPYFILHPVHPVDCIDFDASGAKRLEIGDKSVVLIKKFVVDPSKCGALPVLFRPRGLSSHLLVHRPLAEELDALGFSGIGWVEPSAIVGAKLLANFDKFVKG